MTPGAAAAVASWWALKLPEITGPVGRWPRGLWLDRRISRYLDFGAIRQTSSEMKVRQGLEERMLRT